MKKTFSALLKKLSDLKKSQPETATTWNKDVDIIEAASANGQTLWWVRHDPEAPFLDDKALTLLATHHLAEHEAVPVKKKFGRLTQFAVGVDVGQLEALSKSATAETKPESLVIMTRRVKDLEKQLKQAREANAADYAMAELLRNLDGVFGVPSGKAKVRFNASRAPSGKAMAGTPSLFLSDWHWGETVDSSQVERLNEYDLDIAKERADRVFRTTLELLFHHQSGLRYDGMVIPMGGDMLSGEIHDELRNTNAATVNECILSLAETLSSNLLTVSENFEWVYVPCVVGNHGRTDAKPSAKNAVRNNHDWLLYQIVTRMVRGQNKDRNNVEFEISESLDTSYKIYGTRYLLTHGDQFKTATNSSNFWGSMLDNMQRKQQRSISATNGGFDHMLCGHFHKYGTASNVIVNGSLKGYDEWVYKMNYEYERPIQALWITHPEYGITSHYPVFADNYVSDSAMDLPPITKSSELQGRR